ncbi:hypothetical protein OAK19_05500 [Aureispira]|nr:hypothetical protein [Aureispira sp.]
MKKASKYLMALIKYHLHILLYFYFWLGIFIGGLVAPIERIEMLNSNVITEGWHISLLSVFLIFPVFVIYSFRMKRDKTT